MNYAYQKCQGFVQWKFEWELKLLKRTEALNERKHDVYGKRQTANGKNGTFAVRLQFSVE